MPKPTLEIPQPEIPVGVDPESYIRGYLAGYGRGYKDGVKWAGDTVQEVIRKGWGRDSK